MGIYRLTDEWIQRGYVDRRSLGFINKLSEVSQLSVYFIYVPWKSPEIANSSVMLVSTKFPIGYSRMVKLVDGGPPKN